MSAPCLPADVVGPAQTVTPARSADSGWIVAPGFDLVFFANLAWVLALVPGLAFGEGRAQVEFWQIYFLTTPHRWLTLLLVVVDPDRREGRGGMFALLAVIAAAVVIGVPLAAGTFLCLLLVDYIWNGWHFAAQHFGVLRMYGRKAGGGWPRLERYGLRLFIFYVIARTAAWATGWLDDWPAGLATLDILDVAALAVPATLVALELSERSRSERSGCRLGKRAYLLSVCGLYASLLLAVRAEHRLLILALMTASATFHAVEYLALVTHYAWRRRSTGATGLFQVMAGRWLALLSGYVIVLGVGALLLRSRVGEFWLGLNIWASFLHYAYDGMIWKLRRPATAQALGVAGPSGATP